MDLRAIGMAIGGASLLVACAEASYAGAASYRLDVITVGEVGVAQTCLTVHKDGVIEMPDTGVSLAWVPSGVTDNGFVAVSVAEDAAGTNEAVGAHGQLIADTLILGATQNQHGIETVFVGVRTESCELPSTQPSAVSACLQRGHTAIDAPVATDATCSVLPVDDPAAQLWSGHPNLCAISHCDPDIDPLRSAAEATNQSELLGRSFVIAMDDAGASTQCWTFDPRGDLSSRAAARMTWAPDYLGSLATEFQVMMDTSIGFSQRYVGRLIDGGVLEIRGVKAWADRAHSVSAIGYEVRECQRR